MRWPVLPTWAQISWRVAPVGAHLPPDAHRRQPHRYCKQPHRYCRVVCPQRLSPCSLRASSAASRHAAARHRPGPRAPQQRLRPGLPLHLVAAASMGVSRYAPAIPSAARRQNHNTGSAVPAAAPPKARHHHTATQHRPHWPRLARVRSPRLRLRCSPPVPKPSRGPRLLRIALRSHIQAPGPALCIIRWRSSGRTLLLSGHLGHIPITSF
ncbi:hypothetical protein NDU88_004000 [Pleurodeles waltl]|uniref:Uncharacterized protein n=1 Tax=Pleurodeles waltl TaxID=8319 RepID=A0AAV7L055_PLEWA|nr:hypothetical protein NDU88_004000 [Pleurodeles waltl]